MLAGHRDCRPALHPCKRVIHAPGESVIPSLDPPLIKNQSPVPPIRRLIEGGTTATLSRLALYVLGFLRIQEEQVARKRGLVSFLVHWALAVH